jgi:hypothetical protein
VEAEKIQEVLVPTEMEDEDDYYDKTENSNSKLAVDGDLPY